MLPYQQAESTADLTDAFEQKAIEVVHTLLLNDSVMPMTFFCETDDDRQILILYFLTEHAGMENKINMIKAIMLLHDARRYIFASETWIPSKPGLLPDEDGDRRDGLVMVHAGRQGLEKAVQYLVKRTKSEISLYGKEESESLETNTVLDSLLVGPPVSAIQRQELRMIVGSLPEHYPVKAYELSDDVLPVYSSLRN